MAVTMSEKWRGDMQDIARVEGTKPGVFTADCPNCHAAVTDWQAIGRVMYMRCSVCLVFTTLFDWPGKDSQDG